MAAYYAQLTEPQTTSLDDVAMEMWEPYTGTCDGLPQGDTKIVFDRLHIMRDMTKAVDAVRKHFEVRGESFLRRRDPSMTEPADARSTLRRHTLPTRAA